MKIGIFGGTFNPIHKGHIDIMKKIYNKMFLDKVLIMPNKIPPHKDINFIVNEKHRELMVRKAIMEYDFLEFEDYELKKNDVSYTYESLLYLNEVYKEDQLFFIIGSDSFVNFYKWKNINMIFENASIVVYLRKEEHKEYVSEIKEKYEKLYKGKIHLIFDNIIDISSTEIRNKILKGEDVKNLVPKYVYEYIISKKLYRE